MPYAGNAEVKYIAPPVARPKIKIPHFSVCISVRSERSSGTGFHPHNEGI
jgi:hypothetical protein